MSSLQQKSVIGIAWNLTEQFGIYFIKFALGVILARLLTPEAFGLVGMIYVFFAVAEMFVKGGLGQAYVQKKEATDKDANTIFYANLIISIAFYVLLFFGAPFIADFYNEPALVELTKVMGLVVVINAFNVIQRAQITRAVNFKRKAKVTLIATLISGSAGITAAYLGMGVWALVIQSMGNRSLVTIGFWLTSTWKPKWQFSTQSFKELFSFGLWALLSGVVQKLFDNIYVLAIGKFFPVAQVGFYTKAKQFQRMASENLSGAIGSVAFPVYSKIQDDKERLRNGMRKFLQHSLLFIIPLLLMLIVVAKPFIILLLKEKWAPMIPYLQLLCVAGVLYPIHMVNVQALTAQGKVRLTFKLNLIKNGLRLINIFVMYPFGVIYIIIGEVILSFIALFINTYFTNKMVNYGFWKQAKDTWKIIAGGIVAGGIAFLPNLTTDSLPILLLTGVLLTLGIFAGSQYLFNRKLFLSTIQLKNNFKKL